MIPNFIMWLSRFPETLNGKIDVNNLPDIAGIGGSKKSEVKRRNNHITPQNHTEEKLHDIFVEIIGYDGMNISTTESLLNVGMTSIMFPTCVKRIEKEFGKKIKIPLFIKNSTISMCAKLIDDNQIISI